MLISFFTTIKYGLLSWIRRELSCKYGILTDKSDSGLSQLVSLRFDLNKSQILLLDCSYCYICILSLSSLWFEPKTLTCVVSSYFRNVLWSHGNFACV
ncbi:hypothetical protein Bca4012_009835 [Brassica carinata]